MKKRIVALLLCLVSVVLCLTACAKNEDDKGAYIRMYLSEPVYDLDPLTAFDNEAALQVISLLYEPLFYAEDDGDVKKGLVDDYEYVKDEDNDKYSLILYLKETCWSDGVAVSAKDVQFSFLRLFDTNVSHPATALLYDIKNARAIVAGDSKDHLGVSIVNNTTVEIEFERDIDVDDFLVNLTSPALYPLRDDVVEGNENWAKSRSSIVCSGPFQLRSMNLTAEDGFILERNAYYYRDRTKDDLDKYVTPFRLIVNYKKDAVEQLKQFGSEDKGALYYFGHIPLEARKDGSFAELLEDVKTSDAASTHVYYLNHKVAPFGDANVRKALSLAIDRNAIVDAVVYAKAAEGLVPYTVLNRPDRDAEFRDKVDELISASANVEEAKRLLSEAKITPSAYSFSITVAAYDEDHMAMAKLVQAAWKALGFNVSINALDVKPIMEWVDDDPNDAIPPVEEATGMYTNPYREALQSGDFDVIALDLVATSPDAFSYLAPFATAFSGNAINMDYNTNPNYDLTPHITGYQSEAYEAKIEEAYAAEKNRKTAKLLAEAEKILIADDMAVIPIVHNQDVSLRSKQLKGIDTNFYCNANFIKAKLKNHWELALRDGFVEEKVEEEE